MVIPYPPNEESFNYLLIYFRLEMDRSYSILVCLLVWLNNLHGHQVEFFGIFIFSDLFRQKKITVTWDSQVTDD